MVEVVLILAFLLAMLIGFYGTPLTIRIAHNYKILDYPDGKLKKQQQPVAYLGGLIVYFAAIFPLSLLIEFNQQFLGIVFASLILLLIGLFDDLKAMTPRIKFFFQLIAAFILVKSGIFINLIFLPEWLNALLTFFWILTLINAFNIIDVLDGLAGLVALIGLIGVLTIAIIDEFYLVAFFCASLSGALLAFLRFNFPPARIYLGDTGSQVLGMLMGTFVIIIDYSAQNRFGFLSAIAIVALPLFDLIYVVILRLLKGKSPFRGSADHFALRLKRKYAGSTRRVLVLTGVIQLLLTVLAVINIFLNPLFSSLLAVITLLFFLLSAIYLKRFEEEPPEEKRIGEK